MSLPSLRDVAMVFVGGALLMLLALGAALVLDVVEAWWRVGGRSRVWEWLQRRLAEWLKGKNDGSST